MIDFSDSDDEWFISWDCGQDEGTKVGSAFDDKLIPAPTEMVPAYVMLAYDGEFTLNGIPVRNYEARAK